jgi:hypothetical protein
MRTTLIALFAIVFIGFVSPAVASARRGFHGSGAVSWGGGWGADYRWHGPDLVGCNRRRRLRLWVSLRVCALLRQWLFFCTAALLGWLWLAFAGRSGLRLRTTGTLRRNHHRVRRSRARRYLRRNFKVSRRVRNGRLVYLNTATALSL